MRIIAVVALVLGLGLWWGCCSDLKQGETSVSNARWGEPATGWRKTAWGWEDARKWRVGQEGLPPTLAARIHPGLAALLLVALACGVLVLFTPAEKIRTEILYEIGRRPPQL